MTTEPPTASRQLALRVPFPELRVMTWSANRMADFGSAFYDFLKDFAIPILAVVLGFVFQRTREREKDEREDKIEREAQRHEVWRQMLPRVHENAQRFYMPISTAVWRFLEEFDRRYPTKAGLTIRDPTAIEDRMFYYLVIIYTRFTALSKEIGGFYFKSRGGEDLAVNLWRIFCDRLVRRPESLQAEGDWIVHEDIEELAAEVDPHETIYHFARRSQVTHPVVQSPDLLREIADFWKADKSRADRRTTAERISRIRSGFDAWLTRSQHEELRQDVCLLRILEKILDYEMNLPYAIWYEESETLEVQDCQTWLKKVAYRAGAEQEDSFNKFKSKAEDYLQAIKSRQTEATRPS